MQVGDYDDDTARVMQVRHSKHFKINFHKIDIFR